MSLKCSKGNGTVVPSQGGSGPLSEDSARKEHFIFESFHLSPRPQACPHLAACEEGATGQEAWGHYTCSVALLASIPAWATPTSPMAVGESGSVSFPQPTIYPAFNPRYAELRVAGRK